MPGASKESRGTVQERAPQAWRPREAEKSCAGTLDEHAPRVVFRLQARTPTLSLRTPEGREAIQGFLPCGPGSRRRRRLLAMTLVRRAFLPEVPSRSFTA